MLEMFSRTTSKHSLAILENEKKKEEEEERIIRMMPALTFIVL